MDELPAGAARLALVAAGDAMADALEAAELLDVDVDQLAGMLALVTADRLGRLQGGDAIEAEPPEDAADRRRRDAGFGGDLLAGPALAAQGFDLRDDGRRRRPVQAARPRGTISKARNAFRPEAGQPLANRLHRYAQGQRHRLCCLALNCHPGYVEPSCRMRPATSTMPQCSATLPSL